MIDLDEVRAWLDGRPYPLSREAEVIHWLDSLERELRSARAKLDGLAAERDRWMESCANFNERFVECQQEVEQLRLEVGALRDDRDQVTAEAKALADRLARLEAVARAARELRDPMVEDSDDPGGSDFCVFCLNQEHAPGCPWVALDDALAAIEAARGSG